MVKPAPISLRIRAAEATARARKILDKLDEDERLRQRISWLAVKALVSVREMKSAARPKLRSISDRDRWEAKCKLIEEALLGISKRGVE